MVTLIILLIGPSVVGNFVYQVFNFIFVIGVVVSILSTLYNYTFGKNSIGVWGLFRLVGIVGILFAGILLYINIKAFIEKDILLSDILWDQAFASTRTSLFAITGLFFFFLVCIGLGEFLLYQHKILTNTDRSKLDLNKSNEMFCPRCVGKGYMDVGDIKRMGMEKYWNQGVCNYCNGQGYVERGKTTKWDPIMFHQSV
jgi:hypothetical protein